MNDPEIIKLSHWRKIKILPSSRRANDTDLCVKTKITKVSEEKMRKESPEFLITNAVKGMLPHNRLGRQILKHLKVFTGPVHPHNAQQPKPLEL